MTILFREMRASKLARLVELEDFENETALFELAIADSVCPAICCNPDNPDCEYTAEMEPDQDRGWCDACERGTAGLRARARGPYLMSAERYRLRADRPGRSRSVRAGWYYARSANAA